jgi:ribosomal protein S18 acetylase RimI-like enzyme
VKPVLRPAGPDDQEFLFRLYASTRQDEFAGVGLAPAQLEALLRMQWSAQRRWYETAYAEAESQIVLYGDTPIGRAIVLHGATATTLVDISLIPEYRGRGIGSLLLRDLIEQCSRKNVSLCLQVLKTNPAVHLYLRLGFTQTSEDGMYFQMEKPVS